MLNGDTRIIAHVGYPTTTFKSPMIYNPWFAAKSINAAVVPLGVKSEDFSRAFPEICRFTNFAGALVTMPHKVAVLDLIDEVSKTVEVCGACNAVRLDARGRRIGDMFDGEGFVRGAKRNGAKLADGGALVVGAGGVGSAIAASLAASGVARLGLYDVHGAAMEALASRLAQHYPEVQIAAGSADPEGYDVVVNATPLGMKSGDPLPLDVSRLSPSTYVGEVVLKQETTAFLEAARARGCRTQIGLDMLFEQIPAYLEFFGFPTATAEELREGAEIRY
jgi:shikimate dehydrogenase